MAAVQSMGDTDWTEHCCWQIVAISRVGRRVSQRQTSVGTDTCIHASVVVWGRYSELLVPRHSKTLSTFYLASPAPFQVSQCKGARWCRVTASTGTTLAASRTHVAIDYLYANDAKAKPHQALLTLSSAMTHTNRFPWQFLFVFCQSRANFFALVSFMRPLCRECKYVSLKNSWYICIKDHWFS